MRHLALLADRNESGRHLMRHRAADDEAARLDAGDLVDLHAGPGLHHLVHGAAERARIAEQRGDVAKHNARLGIVGDVADRGFEIVFQCGRGHGDFPFSTLPATASSFLISSGSRASCAVTSALSSALSEPIGHGSCSRGKSCASRATRRCARVALSISTLMMSGMVTASWSGCQQSKSVTMATVA